ncbi:class I SAM-dependent methyltransferase [Hyphomicrobium sp. D-2]|uniref:class I SAM-dependent methyltransferase n=1 Tax=Hyphomicrobium sp. D-2 TaxID=3041621 RepID=UPI002456531A|nr:class I SAM-dependent methyltransferase [Hyphomicrobium sp. D-2]MDH4980676.1 class I SAM-dependent methyltransferase [Hyphomicrobium sp. D-2]
MSRTVQWMDNRFFPEHGKNWDDTLFRERIIAHLRPESTVLDLGAGAGIVKQMDFRNGPQGRLAARICGVDLDPRVEQNPCLDEGRRADGGSIPYADTSFDLVFADNVLEHLSTPAEVFSEVARVLKPDGLFLFKTPNKWHYMPLISRSTPHAFHRWINRRRGRNEIDTFPTVYRANSRRDIHRLAAQTGFAVENIELIEGRPEYLRMHPITYAAGLAYERTVNISRLLSNYRILLIGTLRKIS